MKKPKNALNAGQYWEWRTTISELEVAKANARIAELELNIIHKDAEVLMVKAQLFSKVRLEPMKAATQAAAAEYTRFKEVLEKDLGQSLSGKLIDDVTFEIRELPEDTKKLP